MEITTKLCPKCIQKKSLLGFSPRSLPRTGVRSYCKACEKQYNNSRPKTHIPKIGSKVCSNCRQSKPATEFYRNSKAADGLFSCCVECEKIKAKEFRALPENKEKKQLYALKYKGSKQRKT